MYVYILSEIKLYYIIIIIINVFKNRIDKYLVKAGYT